MKNKRVPHIFIQKILKNKEIEIYDGTQTADLIHLSDVVKAIWFFVLKYLG